MSYRDNITTINKSNLANVAKNLRVKMKEFKDREKLRGFKSNPFDRRSLIEQYKFYCYLHNGDREKALFHMNQFKKISNDVLNEIMFEGAEIIAIETKPEGTTFDEGSENNLLNLSEYIKTSIKDMELGWSCKIINR